MVNKIRMSRKEAAEKLGISSKTVDRWIVSGRLEADMSLGRERFVLVPEDALPGYTVPRVSINDTGDGQPEIEPTTNELTLKAMMELDKVNGLTPSQAQTYDIMTVHVAKARERLGLLEKPENLREREEVVFQAESILSDEQEAILERQKKVLAREKAVTGLEDERNELDAILLKVGLVKKWCTDTVAAIQRSPVWEEAYHAEKSQLPDWPAEVDAYEIQNWGTEEKQKKVAFIGKGKPRKETPVIVEDVEFDDNETEPDDEEGE